MVGWKESVVLCARPSGLHDTAAAAAATHDAATATYDAATATAATANNVTALRLCCRFRQLAGWMVGREEGMVLRPHEEGLLPTTCAFITL